MRHVTCWRNIQIGRGKHTHKITTTANPIAAMFGLACHHNKVTTLTIRDRRKERRDDLCKIGVWPNDITKWVAHMEDTIRRKKRIHCSAKGALVTLIKGGAEGGDEVFVMLMQVTHYSARSP